jgi:predicted ATPase
VDITNINGYALRNLDRINIILGKNGVGKSKMFQQIESGMTSQPDAYESSKYITPGAQSCIVEKLTNYNCIYCT